MDTSKTCNKPYIFPVVSRPLQPLWKFLQTQHMGVNPFSTYPVSEKQFVHKPSIAHPPALCKTSKSNLHFSVIKSNRWFIGKSASPLIGRTDRGFDFLGYYFGPAGLAIAQKTLYNFVTRTSRLYEQGADATRLWQYVTRWTRWLWAGLDGMVSREGCAIRYWVYVLKKLQILGF